MSVDPCERFGDVDGHEFFLRHVEVGNCVLELFA